MKRSKYNIGECLVATGGRKFIHDGYVNSDGLEVVIGEDGIGQICKSSGSGNWQVDPSNISHIASDEEKEAFYKKLRNQTMITNW